MRLLHWNVNGLRSLLPLNILPSLLGDYDIICMNETKLSDDSQCAAIAPAGYHVFSSIARRRGYSGVCVFTRIDPLRRLSIPFPDDEGRLVILEFSSFILVSVYVPNSGASRLRYRTRVWDPQFQLLCSRLARRKPLLILGDMNVAHEDIDIYKPERHRQQAGFTDVERFNFGMLLRTVELTDVWRARHPGVSAFTYFDYRTRARARNAGWRLDYALASESLVPRVRACRLLPAVPGSDHIPVEILMDEK